MNVDPHRGRRWIVSYAISLTIHALALLVLVFLAISDVMSGATEIVDPSAVTLIHQDVLSPADAPKQPTAPRETASPHVTALVQSVPSPPTSAKSPLPTRPVLAWSNPPSDVARDVASPQPRGVHTLPHPTRPRGIRGAVVAGWPELSHNVADASPAAHGEPSTQPAPRPSTAPQPAASLTQVIAPTASITLPTAIPTVAPTSQPTQSPSPPPTTSPTSAPATIAPTVAPTAVPTVAIVARSTVAPTPERTIVASAPPSAKPTTAPTPEPSQVQTAPPTAVPTARPTLAPTRPPTSAPVIAETTPPTAAPTRAPPTASPTHAPPTAAPTVQVLVAPSLAPSAAPTRAATVATATATHAPAPSAATRGPANTGGQTRVAANGSTQRPGGASKGVASHSAQRAPASGAGADVALVGPTAGAHPGSGMSLNDRLRALSGGTVDYTPKRVAIGDAQSVFDDAMAAYEARLAPPPDILRRTFGYIYKRRTAGEPDSLAYVYDTYAIGPITVCKAWKIIEHPYVPVHEVGPVGGSAGIGGAVANAQNLPVVRHDMGSTADVQTVVFPCSPSSYTAVPAGSLTSPLPLHPGPVPVRGSTAAPAALGTPIAPLATPSLAP